MTLPAIADNAVLIALGVLIPGAMAAGPMLHKRRKAQKAARQALEDRRDSILDDVAKTLKELSGDVKCLYRVTAPQLEALEVTLRALHGEKVNGNVKKAIDEVVDARKKLDDRLMDKVGDCP